jgi:hypothetical protein
MLALATSAVFTVPARIFNHDIMGCTAEGVSGNHLYSGRALAMTEPGDLIQLHPHLKPQWPFIYTHYQRVGLTFTDKVVWHVQHRALAEHRQREISVFYFGPGEQEARPNSSWHRVVHFINSKNNFMALADKLGVPTPGTLCFMDVADIGEADLAAIDFPCYIKAAVSVSGVGIYRCADAADLREALTRFEPGIPVQVQAEVVSNLFLNLQYEADDYGFSRLEATEQVLDGPVHQGNRYPTEHAPWECVEPMAEWLYKEGMRGLFAFDVAVVDRPGGVEYLAIECNPRFNGASYPSVVARKLGIDQWLARAFDTGHRSLADLDLRGLEFDGARGEGVVLVNWGTILVGKLMVLLAGPPAVQERLAMELAARL